MKNNLTKSLSLFCGCILVLSDVSVAFAAKKTAFTKWNGSFSVSNAQAFVSSCDNSGGPTINFSGDSMILGYVNGKIKITNNKMDTKTGYSVLNNVPLTFDFTGKTSFDKQGIKVDGISTGVTGNPWIAFYYTNGGPDTVIGRCVQGISAQPNGTGPVFNNFSIDLSTSVCSPLTTAITHQPHNAGTGVTSNIILENNLTNPQHSTNATGILSLRTDDLTPQSSQPSGKSQNVAGGNPHVYLQLTDANKNPLVLKDANGVEMQNVATTTEGKYYYFGRCRDLMVP